MGINLVSIMQRISVCFYINLYLNLNSIQFKFNSNSSSSSMINWIREAGCLYRFPQKKIAGVKKSLCYTSRSLFITWLSVQTTCHIQWIYSIKYSVYKKQAFLSHNQKVDVYWKAETKPINQLCGDRLMPTLKSLTSK
jgi:hypothetical protein